MIHDQAALLITYNVLSIPVLCNTFKVHTVVCISGKTVLDLNRTHVCIIKNNLLIKLKTIRFISFANLRKLAT